MKLFGKSLLALAAGALFYAGGRWLIARIQPVPDDLGVYNGQLRPCQDMPNCVHSQSADERHAIAPFTYSDSDDAAQERLFAILDELPRTLIDTAQDNYVHATAESWGWGYIDDLEFLFNDGRVDVRSGARLPYYDFGKNRQRVEELRALWEAQRP